mmetsp:Transcript_47924/g.144876  ORF Transcript_47924/g.144876 Transcript_47924/m.144876 type:complete len:93 (+) Transcript_47924:344-622(+)
MRPHDISGLFMEDFLRTQLSMFSDVYTTMLEWPLWCAVFFLKTDTLVTAGVLEFSQMRYPVSSCAMESMGSVIAVRKRKGIRSHPAVQCMCW